MYCQVKQDLLKRLSTQDLDWQIIEQFLRHLGLKIVANPTWYIITYAQL